MKKLTLLTAAIVFAATPLLTAAETWDGVISDARCNGKHSKAEHGSQEESDASCVTKCVSGGQKYVFVSSGKTFQIGQKVTVAGSLLLVITALGIGWRFWANRQAEAQMTADIAAARREETRLAEVLKQVSDFEAQRAILQKRVALIDELRKGQNAPVHMIDQISRSLPEMTWLTEMRQEGFDVTIRGRCLSLTSLSDFVGNLEATRYFKRPVEILSSEVVSGSQGAPDTIQFAIRGSFQMAGIDQIAPAAPTKGRAKAPAKGGPRG